jgi:hypothetical protein
MTRFVFATATSLDGFLADPDNSLEWLFAVEGGEESMTALDAFVDGVGVMVEGSTTYRWVLEHERLLDAPEKWQQFYGAKPTFVFSSRDDLPLVPGADIRVVSGPVADHLDAIRDECSTQRLHRDPRPVRRLTATTAETSWATPSRGCRS